jgi:hypothetical protein
MKVLMPDTGTETQTIRERLEAMKALIWILVIALILATLLGACSSPNGQHAVHPVNRISRNQVHLV